MRSYLRPGCLELGGREARDLVAFARQGYLISTGEPKRHYISEAVRHVQMRQGTIGILSLIHI